ncbi:MAG: ferredoxin [Pseudomonadota bacterium]
MGAGLDALIARLAVHGLAVTGAFHPTHRDGVPGLAPEAVATLCLVGPVDGAMWQAFRAAPEAGDGGAHPMDRWSHRVIGAAAAAEGGEALFPFQGPPWLPFLRWAMRAEGAAGSPLGMVVTPTRGLLAAWRGAVVLPGRRPLPAPPGPLPCAACHAPCRTACPADAFAGGAYDAVRCRTFLAEAEGAVCRDGGCQARRACPASWPMPPEQATFHLDAFRRSSRTGA